MAPGLNIVRRCSFKASPWKNGGGITHEAARRPLDGDRFRWRVSVAEVGQSGPFSDFAGYRRTMVLLRGSGLELRFGDGLRLDLRQVGDMVEFDGALPAECRLVEGPCTDFNLMVANQVTARASVERLSEPLVVVAAEGETTLLFSITSPVQMKHGSGEVACLEPCDLAILSGWAGELLLPSEAASATPSPVFFATISDT